MHFTWKMAVQLDSTANMTVTVTVTVTTSHIQSDFCNQADWLCFFLRLHYTRLQIASHMQTHIHITGTFFPEGNSGRMQQQTHKHMLSAQKSASYGPEVSLPVAENYFGSVLSVKYQWKKRSWAELLVSVYVVYIHVHARAAKRECAATRAQTAKDRAEATVFHGSW
jgi:hypothetical protein